MPVSAAICVPLKLAIALVDRPLICVADSVENWFAVKAASCVLERPANAVADKVGAHVGGVTILFKDGSPMKAGAFPALAHGKALYVGDPVAVVIADTYAQARDAAEKVVVDYGVLPAVVDQRNNPIHLLNAVQCHVHGRTAGDPLHDRDVVGGFPIPIMQVSWLAMNSNGVPRPAGLAARS